MRGLHEKAVEVVAPVAEGDHDGEADRHIVASRDDPDPASGDEVVGKLDRVGVRGKLLAVVLPDIRRPPLQRLKSGALPDPSVANDDLIGHRTAR